MDIVLALEGSVYTFAFDDLLGRGPPRSAFLFGARAGFTVNTDLFWDYRHRPSSEDAPAIPKEAVQPKESSEEATEADGADGTAPAGADAQGSGSGG
jgi:hypothetical protein